LENAVRQSVLICCVFWLCFALPSLSVYSQTKTAIKPAGQSSVTMTVPNPAVEAIKKEIVAFADAFNKRDAKAVAAFWSAEGEYVDDNGRAFVGRNTIETYYTELLKEIPDVKLKLVSDSIRLLGDTVAVEDGQAVLEPKPKGDNGSSKYTAIYTKVGNRWLLASVRDSNIDTASPSNDLVDLEWLIGDWTAEENGTTTESKCRWIVDKQFVERSYTTTMIDGSKTSGLQIIGWNPQANRMQSWSFTADGGSAIGVWSAIDSGWAAKVIGTTGSGDSTSAVNTLKRIDDNAYAWQSTDRTIGDVNLPDTNEVVIRRVKLKK